ncbi:ubiquitin-associated domain-containing protein 2 [Cricetulus griseus]|nr:ubiquitin-associated domain-containing protein 2 [Cricetulus griseus]
MAEVEIMVSCYSVFGEEASVKDPGMRQFIQKIGDYLLCRQPLNNKDKAPLSKSLLLVPSALSLLLALLLPHCQKFFAYDLHAVKNDFQIWRLVCGRIICLDLKDTFCSSLLIYNFRIFERRYGSRKFASFLLGSWVLSALFDLILVEAVQYSFGITVASNLPSGFFAIIP